LSVRIVDSVLIIFQTFPLEVFYPAIPLREAIEFPNRKVRIISASPAVKGIGFFQHESERPKEALVYV